MSDLAVAGKRPVTEHMVTSQQHSASTTHMQQQELIFMIKDRLIGGAYHDH